MTRNEVLLAAARTGARGVSHAPGGAYVCHSCGEQWRPFVRKEWWPIRLHWARAIPGLRHSWFAWHGIEYFRPDSKIEQRHVTQVFHLGRLKVRLGRNGA